MIRILMFLERRPYFRSLDHSCGKPLRSNDDVELHSARTGHVNFKESAEVLKPLSEAEKHVQMRRLQEAILQRKKKREEEDRQKYIEDEKNRRLQGKASQSAKAMFREEMMRREAEMLKKDRAENKAYREKLLSDVAAERAERAAKPKDTLPKVAPGTAASPSRSKLPNSAECRIQIRTPIGEPLRRTFNSSENLGAVVLYVSQNWPMDPDGTMRTTIDSREIVLQTTFPNRKFGEEDVSKTLNELGLCPTAVLMARRNVPS
ncbi:UBX domain-containing protein 1-A [Taenia crassiceps]|uniref:UBX domain-containing protein 1-A n=1 Tax=Taenia crassiceps TaxID=6207 RepID=A0ABR4QSV6_9CEST